MGNDEEGMRNQKIDENKHKFYLNRLSMSRTINS